MSLLSQMVLLQYDPTNLFINLQISHKYGLIYVITKLGLLILLLRCEFEVLLQLNNMELDVSLAKRGNPPGAENVVKLL